MKQVIFPGIMAGFPFDNNIERNALLVPQIRRNIVVEKWTENTLGKDFEEVSLKGTFFHSQLSIRRVKAFFG